MEQARSMVNLALSVAELAATQRAVRNQSRIC